MAKTISQLTTVPGLASGDFIPVVDVSDTPDVTKKATVQQILDLAPPGTTIDLFANRPAAGTAGRRFLPTDGFSEWVDTGSIWRPVVNGRLRTAPPTVAAGGWTIVDAGSPACTFTDDKGTIHLANDPQGSTSIRRTIVARTPPGTPYTLSVGYEVAGYPAATVGTGIALRDSATQRFLYFFLVNTGGGEAIFALQAMNSSTSYSGDQIGAIQPITPHSGKIWLHLNDPGTGNLTWSFSGDGDYSRSIIMSNSSSRTAWVANPDQICLVMSNNTAETRGRVSMRVFDWTIT